MTTTLARKIARDYGTAALPDKPKPMVALGSGVTNSRATAISACELEQVDFRAVEAVMSRNSEWAVGVFSAMTMHALVKERRERELLMFTPEERYRRFLEDYPELVESVAQKDIASYLGITPVGLSRIVRRVRESRPALEPTGAPDEA